MVPRIVFIAAFVASSALAQAQPSARWGHAFVYDELRDEVLLFGGAAERNVYLDDTWTLKDGKWKRHAVQPPPARGFAAAAFDPRRGAVVIQGGRASDGSTLTDTWQWDGSKWSALATDGPRADHHAMAFDIARNTLVAFGGWTGTAVTGETWTFDGTWRLASKRGPPPRSAFGMAYDSASKRVVLYGGLWINGQYADTFAWDGRKWTALTGPYDDSSLDHHSMIYDGTRNQFVLFGGKNYRREMSRRTLTWRDKRWTSVSNEGPSPRHSTQLAFDRKRGATLLFGGKEYRGEEQLPLGDFWQWDGQRWHLVTP